METERQLVSFGEYLLSDERVKRIVENTQEGESVYGRLQQIYHADLENWKNKIEIG